MDNQCPHETFKGLYQVTKDKESLLKKIRPCTNDFRKKYVKRLCFRRQRNYFLFCQYPPKIAYIWINSSLNLKNMSRLLKLNFSSHRATYHGFCLLTFLSHWWYLRRVCVYVGMNMYVYMIRKQRIYPFDLHYFFCIFIS